MTRIFAIANQKGGVGKTTTSINLASSLASIDKRVLLVDLDPQGNTTMGSGVDKRLLDRTVYQILLGEQVAAEVRLSTKPGKYHLLPANQELAGAEVEMVALEQRESRLKKALQVIQADYDFILIDCPPALNLLTLNGLCAAHAVIIPMQCEYYALEGLSDLVNTIKRVRTGFNPAIRIEGLLRTMFDPRNLLAQQVSDQLKQHFGDKVYRTIIPRNIRLAEAPGFGLPVLYHDKQSRGAQAYLELANEILATAN
ncbi:ParA family protein [Nitrosomonas europaea]|uniref:ParA family protein n=1 Tax=Nitrosomonas europaea TaxID=915 RepID=UPI003267ECD3